MLTKIEEHLQPFGSFCHMLAFRSLCIYQTCNVFHEAMRGDKYPCITSTTLQASASQQLHPRFCHGKWRVYRMILPRGAGDYRRQLLLGCTCRNSNSLHKLSPNGNSTFRTSANLTDPLQGTNCASTSLCNPLRARNSTYKTSTTLQNLLRGAKCPCRTSTSLLG